MSTSDNALAALARGEQFVAELLQPQLIDFAAQLGQAERSAAIAGVLCRITSIGLVLIGTEETQRLLALSVAAAPFAPPEAIRGASVMREVLDALARNEGALND